jgi:hypothetical protein
VEINEVSEAIISIPEVAEVIIEVVVGAIFKIPTGIPDKVERVVDSTILLGMSHRNKAHLNNNTRPSLDLMMELLSTMRLLKKRMPRICSDHPRTYKSRTRRKLRRMMMKRCHLRVGHLQ